MSKRNFKFGNKTRTDKAAELAKANGIRLKDIGKGSGENGKILLKDVERYISLLKKTTIYSKVTPKALEFIKKNNVNPNDITGTGKDGRITKTDVKKYVERKEKFNMEKFFKKTGIRTAIILILGYFLKVGTFPFTKNGAINTHALKELSRNQEYPRSAKAAKKILELLKLGLNPKFLSILEKNPKAGEYQLYKNLKFIL